MDVQIFLARADTMEPALPDGLPRDAALEAAKEAPAPPRAAELPRERILADYGADPGELDRQRWGIVVPRGDHGKELLRAIDRLRAKRAEDQKAAVEVYEVDPGMTAERTDLWIVNEYRDQVGRVTERLPRYLLILGGPEQVSWAMQQQLAAVAMVGRLAFQEPEGHPDLEGYEAYVHKVLRWEEDRTRRKPQVILHAARDGSKATDAGRAHLIRPNLALLRQAGDLAALRPFGDEDGAAADVEALRRHGADMMEAARGEATVLFSVSHGLGGGQWASPAEQRARQGALVLGRGEVVTAADVAGRPFLPGGVWFFFACFSAGTPAESLYRPWIARLKSMGRFMKGPEQFVLSLPGDGRPFVAALPQAALRSPEGPLGVVGHVDLATSFSFLGEDYTSAGAPDKPYPERFAGLLKSLAQGRRLGVAFDAVARGFRELDSALASRYARAEEPPPERPEEQREAAEKDERAGLAALWLQRQDLRSFVLLGDPAARLPLHSEYNPWTAASTARRQTPQTMEEAVLEHLKGAPLAEVAARVGVTKDELRRWVDAFMKGARDALSRLRR